VVRRQTTVAEADSCARCESFAGDCSLTLAFLRHWPARLRRPLQPRALLDSPARLLPDPRRSPSDSRTPTGSAEKSYYYTHSSELIRAALASLHVPSSQHHGHKAARGYCKKGMVSAVVSTCSIET